MCGSTSAIDNGHYQYVTGLISYAVVFETSCNNPHHPIANLPFITKLTEKVVARHIEKHLEYNGLHDNQSAYRRGRSTETALLKVHSDIAEALDEGSMTA